MNQPKLTFADLQNLTIEHSLVRVRRFEEKDFADLAAIFDPAFFEWFFTNYKTPQEFVDEKMIAYHKQELVPYVFIDTKTNKVIGISCLYEFSFKHRRVEMGSSFLAKEYQGTGYNALNKYLMIDCLINKLGFNRIQWKTDELNQKSRAAMTKLGFVFEGILRRHAITYTGRVRNSVVFAVTDEDYPLVSKIIQQRVEDKLGEIIFN